MIIVNDTRFHQQTFKSCYQIQCLNFHKYVNYCLIYNQYYSYFDRNKMIIRKSPK
jgi:hypothetical protein